LVQESFIAGFRHEKVKNAECGGSNGGKEKKARVGTKVMHDGTGDDLAERRANADRRADSAEGEIKATSALREVRD